MGKWLEEEKRFAKSHRYNYEAAKVDLEGLEASQCDRFVNDLDCIQWGRVFFHRCCDYGLQVRDEEPEAEGIGNGQ